MQTVFGVPMDEAQDRLENYDRLKAINAELLEAIEHINAELDAYWNDPTQMNARPNAYYVQSITNAQIASYAAIAKAKGQ